MNENNSAIIDAVNTADPRGEIDMDQDCNKLLDSTTERQEDDGSDSMSSSSSSSTSSFDHPYHETALDWWIRYEKRQDYRRQGVEYDSDESSDGSFDSEEYLSDDAKTNGDHYLTASQLLTRNEPLRKWILLNYPLAASNCCFNRTSSQNNFNPNTSHNIGRLAWKKEFRRLQRVFRRLGLHNKRNRHANPNGSDSEKQLIESILPKGFGIPFIDETLSRTPLSLSTISPSSVHTNNINSSSKNHLVLDLIGPPRSGLTSILLSLAAGYVAKTSRLFFAADTIPTKFKNDNDQFSTPVEPRVIFLDLEHGVHAANLFLSIQQAVLSQLNYTSLARSWRKNQQFGSLHNKNTNDINSYVPISHPSEDTMSDMKAADLAIASCLGRIHLVQPRDFTYLTLIATLESLRQRLDHEQIQSRVSSSKQNPPTLLIIDSLTTMDASTKDQESQGKSGVGGSGLSVRKEFYSQLNRLREEHDIVLFASSKDSSIIPETSNNEDSSRKILGSARKGWENMVTHRVMLGNAQKGTSEFQGGFDFVATLPGKVDERSFPYSVVPGGIRCQSTNT